MTTHSFAAISSQNLAALPDIAELRRRCQALAALEAIICPEWEDRYYSYNAFWDEATGEELASMRNGEGDEWLILFNAAGAIINGFAVDSEMNGWHDVTLENGDIETQQEICAGVIASVPAVFQSFLETEPIPSTGTTFCIWRLTNDTAWQIGDIDFDQYRDPYQDDEAPPDGSQILSILDGRPETYLEFAQDYYERCFTLAAINEVFQQRAVDRELALNLNPELADWDALAAELDEIGYPHSLALPGN